MKAMVENGEMKNKLPKKHGNANSEIKFKVKERRGNPQEILDSDSLSEDDLDRIMAVS